MLDLEAYMGERRRQVEQWLDLHLPPETERPAVLHRAMRYSVLAGGKRLRPVLCMASCAAVGGTAALCLPAAAALEIVHTYTLIHDDLPCMDADDLRRGRPTAHVVFGEGNALLAGDALLTLAFEWLAAAPAPAPYPPTQLAAELAVAAGSRGVIAGQVEDLEAEGAPPDADRLRFIHQHKTGALRRAAVRMGAIAGGAPESTLASLSAYGEHVGLAFQIADDIPNATSTPAALGKPAGSDAALGKLTYVAVYGLDAARRKAEDEATLACQAIASLRGDTAPLTALAHYAVRRST